MEELTDQIVAQMNSQRARLAYLVGNSRWEGRGSAMELDLPAQLVERVIQAYREDGEHWLAALPETVARVCANWGLDEVDARCSIGWSLVAFAKRGSDDVVLKITVLESEQEGEVAALRAYQGEAAVRLLEVDVENRASLTERALPGTPLRDLKGEEPRIAAAIDVLGRVPQIPDVSSFRSFHENERQYFECGRGEIAGDLLDLAIRLFDDLSSDSSEPTLVHGDFHPENVVACEKQKWVMIDPDGLVADREFDAATMVRNELWNCANAEQVVAKRLDLFMKGLKLDGERLRSWAFAQAVLAGCWAINSRDPEQVPKFLQAAEILRHAL